MLDGDAGAIRGCGEGDLDGAGAGWESLGSGVSPGDQQSVRRVEFEVAAPYRDAVYVEVEHAPGYRVEPGGVAHPPHDRLGTGQVRGHGLWWGGAGHRRPVRGG